MNDSVLQVTDFRKVYGDVVAVDGISFDVQQGEVFGLAVYLFSWDSRNTARRGHPLLALLFLLPFVVGILIG